MSPEAVENTWEYTRTGDEIGTTASRADPAGFNERPKCTCRGGMSGASRADTLCMWAVQRAGVSVGIRSVQRGGGGGREEGESRMDDEDEDGGEDDLAEGARGMRIIAQ